MKAKTNNESASQSNRRVSSGQASRTAQCATPSSVSREQMIAEAAYFRAERRGFAPGYEVEDWLQAQAEMGHLF